MLVRASSRILPHTGPPHTLTLAHNNLTQRGCAAFCALWILLYVVLLIFAVRGDDEMVKLVYFFSLTEIFFYGLLMHVTFQVSAGKLLRAIEDRPVDGQQSSSGGETGGLGGEPPRGRLKMAEVARKLRNVRNIELFLLSSLLVVVRVSQFSLRPLQCSLSLCAKSRAHAH